MATAIEDINDSLLDYKASFSTDLSLSLQQQATLDRETGGLIFISSLLLPAAGIRMQEPGQFI